MSSELPSNNVRYSKIWRHGFAGVTVSSAHCGVSGAATGWSCTFRLGPVPELRAKNGPPTSPGRARQNLGLGDRRSKLFKMTIPHHTGSEVL